MKDVVVFSLDPTQASPHWLEALEHAPPPGWRLNRVAPRLIVAVHTPRPCPIQAFGRHVAIGEVMTGSGRTFDLAALAALDAAAAARRMSSEAFGGYVLASRRESDGRLWAFRDPSGDLDALVWRRDGVDLLATALPDWLDIALPPETSPDWERLAGFLVDPARQTAGVGLRGVHGLTPGELWTPDGAIQLWRPAAWAAAATRGRSDPGRLAAVVDEAVAAMAQGRVLIEVSGGLDSAIVATSLAARGGEVACALNYHVRDRQGDERGFARAVAARCGTTLVEAQKPELPLDLGELARACARPALNAFDHHHDQDVAARCAALGIDTLLTGQGGDDVFFQAPTPLVAADGLRHGIGPGELLSLARWQGRSVFGLLGAGIAAGFDPRAGSPLRAPPFVTPRAADCARHGRGHPWLENLRALAPAKRLQIAGLANALIVKGWSRRGEAARLRHPLLAQPVIEYCLGLTVPDLTRGRDRGLARIAFGHRLPGAVSRRFTKGRMSAHYGRVLALSLPAIRPLLLDGRLAGAGLIDPQALDPMLSVEHMVWRGGLGPVGNAIMLELWVRGWEARLARRGHAPVAQTPHRPPDGERGRPESLNPG